MLSPTEASLPLSLSLCISLKTLVRLSGLRCQIQEAETPLKLGCPPMAARTPPYPPLQTLAQHCLSFLSPEIVS